MAAPISDIKVLTDLVRDLAGLLDARSDAADQLGLLAVAGKVGELGATIASQSRDEAVELVQCQYYWPSCSYLQVV